MVEKIKNNLVPEIIEELFVSKNYNHIKFLFKNLEESRKYITEYISNYTVKDILESFNIKDLEHIAVYIACFGNLDLIKYLIDRGVKNYNEMVYVASYTNHFDIVKYLIEIGTNINIDNYYIIAKCAAYYGNLEIIKLLISKNVSMTYFYFDVMYISADNGHLDIVKYIIELIDKGVIVRDEEDDDVYDIKSEYRFILEAAKNNGHLDIVEYIDKLL